jgi:hypothetical protein
MPKKKEVPKTWVCPACQIDRPNTHEADDGYYRRNDGGLRGQCKVCHRLREHRGYVRRAKEEKGRYNPTRYKDDRF